MLLKTTSKSKVLYGSDPECAAGYIRKGTLYALPPYWFRHHGVEPIIEDERHPVFIETDMFKVHEDGANFEFAVRPSFNSRDLFDTIQEAARATSEQILKLFPNDVLPNLHFLPTIAWDIERWRNMPEDFFMSTLFGCDPSQDVFNLEKRAKEIDASKHPWRYDGAHIHFSGSPLIASDPHQAIRCQVVTSGLAATHFSPYPDLERARVFLYGIPGNFRIQNYGKKNPFGVEYAAGIEYRTPSATWAGNWEVAKEVLKWAEIGICNLLDEGLGESILPEIIEPAIEAIMTCNQPLAGELLSYVESKL